MAIPVLTVVKAVNTGLMLWESVGPAVQSALENNTDVDLNDLDEASAQLAQDLDDLEAAIARAEAQGR